MTEQHPLTDDTIHTMWGKGDPSQKFEYRLARSAADWQLEQVIDFLEKNIDPDNKCTLDTVALMLKGAMRPQEDNS